MVLQHKLNVLKVPDYSPNGYILEADLIYPKELHDYYSDLPLAPENENFMKLLTIYDKEKYVVHYTTLKLYLRMGLKVKKVH